MPPDQHGPDDTGPGGRPGEPPVATWAPAPPGAGPLPRAGWWGGPPFLDRPAAAPATRSDGGRWLGWTLAGFLAGQIAGYLLALVAAAVAGADLTTVARLAAPPEWYVVSSLVGIWVGFGLGPLLASWTAGTRHPVADLGLRFRWVDLAGLPLGVACQVAVALLYLPFRAHLHNYDAPVTHLTGSAHGSGFLLIAVLTVVGAPVFEELFFRGLLFRGLARVCTPDATPGPRRRLGVVAAVVADGLLFGLGHFEWQQLAGLALFGMVLAALFYLTDRLGPGIVTHASFNLVTVLTLVHSNATVLRWP